MQWVSLVAVASAVCCLVLLAVPRHRARELRYEVAAWSDADLRQALDVLRAELESRAAAPPRGEAATSLPASASSSAEGLVDLRAPAPASFRYAHKKTYATADPIKAAMFLQEHFGGKADSSPFQHHCSAKNGSNLEQPQTKNVYWPATKEQPHGFTVHFVRNPHKAPQAQKMMNASQLGLWVEKWRGNFSVANRFDQFMDNHLGLVFDSLDPLVEGWQRAGVPFICRTWCCGPGMPQFPWHCPGHFPNTFFCEQGCYVEAPHGIIVEALCGLESYNDSRKCLTKLEPGALKIFDLCSDS